MSCRMVARILRTNAMERENAMKLDRWKLIYDDKTIPAQVQGDITIDLWHAGLVKNPYFGMDYKDIEWVARRDFTYQTNIHADRCV